MATKKKLPDPADEFEEADGPQEVTPYSINRRD